MLSLKYKNSAGEVSFAGGGSSSLRLTAIHGLSLADRQYHAVSYANCDGQETVSSRLLPRTITVSGDVSASDAAAQIRDMISVLECAGYLYIYDGEIKRRIYCNQTIFPDAERILRGKIASFAVQFVCDNPFFEDEFDTAVALYSRTKKLATPFSLPTMFGETVAGATVFVESKNMVEPILTLNFSKDISDAATVKILNRTSGECIELNHTPIANESITIDIKNRTAESSVSGNILSELTDESYLGRFMLIGGRNDIEVSAGAVTLGITVKCVYNNKYTECVVI